VYAPRYGILFFTTLNNTVCETNVHVYCMLYNYGDLCVR